MRERKLRKLRIKSISRSGFLGDRNGSAKSSRAFERRDGFVCEYGDRTGAPRRVGHCFAARPLWPAYARARTTRVRGDCQFLWRARAAFPGNPLTFVRFAVPPPPQKEFPF